ncbi:unnamed protein product [Laminaria digitata]
MSDDLEVIMRDECAADAGTKQPQGMGEALVYNFFERDPYTRRHRSRSMADITVPEVPNAVAAAIMGRGNNANGGGPGNGAIGNGKIRVTPAEV